MKKGILAVGILIVLAVAAWFGGRKFFGPGEAEQAAESADVSEGTEDISSNNTEPAEIEASDVSASDVEKEETDTEEDETEAEAAADEGTLYTINTSAGSNLGMVPIVNGNAVVLMDGGSGTTHQGEYMPKEESAFQMKLEEQKALAASEGAVKAWAFYRESSMRDFAFPEGVNAIEKFAFARSGLRSVVIPEGVTSIGSGAFYHCDDLSDVTIPESVTVIEENAFAHTPWFENWMAGGADGNSDGAAAEAPDTEDFLIVGDGILLAYRGTEENPELPPQVKSIAPGAFKE